MRHASNTIKSNAGDYSLLAVSDGAQAGSRVVVFEPNTLLTEHQAAARLALSVRTLQNWRVSGRGPSWIRCGGRSVRYRGADLDEFIAGGVVSSTSEADAKRSAK